MRFFTLFLLLLGTNTVHGKIKSIYLNKNDIPKIIKYEGKFKEALKFTDKKGTHIVITAEPEVDKDGQRTGFIYAWCYLKVRNDLKLQWKLDNLTEKCGNIEAKFIPKTLEVTDLNNDGIGEVWLMYSEACRGDDVPSSLKIIMYQGIKMIKSTVLGCARKFV